MDAERADIQVTSIPDWDLHGVVPPIRLSAPTSRDRSPYSVSLIDFILRFGTTAARREIISGFLNYRDALRGVRIVRGYQWIDGSFIEDIETIEYRDPRDIDVVTLFHLPEGETQETLLGRMPRLFQAEDTKIDYRVDAHYVQLNTDTTESLVDQITYWYSLWSHRRSGRWKGYLKVDLSTVEDHAARASLDAMTRGGDA